MLMLTMYMPVKLKKILFCGFDALLGKLEETKSKVLVAKKIVEMVVFDASMNNFLASSTAIFADDLIT